MNSNSAIFLGPPQGCVYHSAVAHWGRILV